MNNLRDFSIIDLIDIYPETDYLPSYNSIQDVVNRLYSLTERGSREYLETSNIKEIIQLKLKYSARSRIQISELSNAECLEFRNDVKKIIKIILKQLGIEFDEEKESIY